MNAVYFDNHATTALDPQVMAATAAEELFQHQQPPPHHVQGYPILFGLPLTPTIDGRKHHQADNSNGAHVWEN